MSNDDNNYFRQFNSTKLEERKLRVRGTLEQGSVGDIVTGDGEQSTTAANRSPMDVRVRNYLDGSDFLANNYKQVVGFFHVPSQKEVYFKAFLTAYNETFSPDWTEESVYGRADPIYMFKQTTRNITMGIKIPASTVGEAAQNLLRVQTLIQFLYPAYTDVNSGTTIAQSPLLRISFQNLIHNYTNNIAPDDYGVPELDVDASEGLLGALKNLTINYNMEGDVGVFQLNNRTLPKLIEINFDFAVIHEHAIGWSNETLTGQEGESSTTPYTFSRNGSTFPYGMQRAATNLPFESDGATRGLERDDMSVIEQQHIEAKDEERAQQAEANEQARYMGLLGFFRNPENQQRMDEAGQRVGDYLNDVYERLGDIDFSDGNGVLSRDPNINIPDDIDI